MNKKTTAIIVGILGLIIIIIGVRVIYQKKHLKITTLEQIVAAKETLIKTEEDKVMAHETWLTFEKYVGFAKAHDLKGVATLTYKLSPICLDPNKVKECNSMMDDIVALGNIFDEKMFTHIMYDQKQVILSTDFKKEEAQGIRGYSHAVLYFIRAEDGTLKIVGFGPSQGRYLAKLPGQTDLSLDTALADRLRDTDMDGVADYVETCMDPSKGEVCVKTDPLKRDTDGNGYWDGIQMFMK